MDLQEMARLAYVRAFNNEIARIVFCCLVLSRINA